jgi:hypothetical protein
MSTRVEHVAVAESNGGAMSGELSCALPRGGQLGLDPRAGWRDGRIEHAGATLRLSAPLGSFGRVTGLCALEGRREERFRGVLSEATLSVSLTPRPRDRGELELRRMDDGGAPSTEWSADYEVQTERFERFETGFSARDSNRVHIRVAYATNGVGLKDVLVSLDGQQFRYTDSAGDATFDHVARGTHLVALESGSLPEGLSMVTSSRLFVTVDRGTASNFVMFQVARPVVIKRF